MSYGVHNSGDYKHRDDGRHDEDVGVSKPPRVIFHEGVDVEPIEAAVGGLVFAVQYKQYVVRFSRPVRNELSVRGRHFDMFGPQVVVPFTSTWMTRFADHTATVVKYSHEFLTHL